MGESALTAARLMSRNEVIIGTKYCLVQVKLPSGWAHPDKLSALGCAGDQGMFDSYSTFQKAMKLAKNI